MAVDLRTDFQKLTAERADRVCELYKELKANGEGSDTAKWKYIAEKVSEEFSRPCTYIGVRNILIRRGLYVASD